MSTKGETLADPGKIDLPSLESWSALRLAPVGEPRADGTPKFEMPDWLEERLAADGEVVAWTGTARNLIFQDTTIGGVDFHGFCNFPPEVNDLFKTEHPDGTITIECGADQGAPGRIAVLTREKLVKMIHMAAFEYRRHTSPFSDPSEIQKSTQRATGDHFRQVALDHEGAADMARRLMADRKYQPVDPAQLPLLQRLLLATSVELGRIAASDRGRLRADDIPAAALVWCAIAPEGTKFTREVYKWRPRRFGIGTWGGRVPPLMTEFTEPQRAKYLECLAIEDANWKRDHEMPWETDMYNAKLAKTAPSRYWQTPLVADPGE